MDFLDAVSNSKNIPDFFERMEESTFSNGYRGMAANILAADTEGNIAF